MASLAQFIARGPFRKAFSKEARPINRAEDAINVVPTPIPVILLSTVYRVLLTFNGRQGRDKSVPTSVTYIYLFNTRLACGQPLESFLRLADRRPLVVAHRERVRRVPQHA